MYYELEKLMILVVDVLFYGFGVVLFYIMLDWFDKLIVFVLMIFGFEVKNRLKRKCLELCGE